MKAMSFVLIDVHGHPLFAECYRSSVFYDKRRNPSDRPGFEKNQSLADDVAALLRKALAQRFPPTRAPGDRTGRQR
jgi:hypothetical protein